MGHKICHIKTAPKTLPNNVKKNHRASTPRMVVWEDRWKAFATQRREVERYNSAVNGGWMDVD